MYLGCFLAYLVGLVNCCNFRFMYLVGAGWLTFNDLIVVGDGG